VVAARNIRNAVWAKKQCLLTCCTGDWESFEALLLDAERSMDANPQMRDTGKSAITEARRRLGLAKFESARVAKAGGGSRTHFHIKYYVLFQYVNFSMNNR
jgi:hypothetical protein